MKKIELATSGFGAGHLLPVFGGTSGGVRPQAVRPRRDDAVTGLMGSTTAGVLVDAYDATSAPGSRSLAPPIT